MSTLMNEIESTASITFVPQNLIDTFEQAFRSCVERRAFELYERSGRPKGRDWEHWFQAESEYLFARPKVLESHDRYSFIAIVRERPRRKIQICMAPRRVIIRTTVINFRPSGAPTSHRKEPDEQFLLAQWPKDTLPAEADATLDGSLLSVTAWKLNPSNQG